MENSTNGLKYGVSVKIELIENGKVINWTEASTGARSLSSASETACHLSYHQLKDFEKIIRAELDKYVESNNI